MKKSYNLMANKYLVLTILAVILFVASPSLINIMIHLGDQFSGNGRNPISFCNLFFAGNILGGTLMMVLFRKQWSNKNLSSLKRSDWFVLTILSIFSGAIAPLLMFFSIKETLVSNIVLLSRLEPIFSLIITSILLKKHLNLKTVLGLSLSLFGLILAFLLYNLQQMSISFGRGEIFIIFHSLILACSTFLSSTFLSRIHVGIFTVFRTFVGAIIYFFTTIILFGASHFMDIFNPYLYKWTIVYALLIIVVGQLLWYTGLKHLSPQTISLTTSFSPIFGLFFAFFFWAKRRKPI